jgi:acyl carrier protein
MLSNIVRKLLELRYDITVDGLEQLQGRQGILILPNHPAEIDPVILSTILWEILRPRPVVIETFFNLPALTPLMNFIKAIPMADMDFEAGPYKRRRVEKRMKEIAEALRRGDNILLYPSGRLSVTGAERIGGNSGAWMLLRECPDATVALVRIKGLYGSIFSKALTDGVTPDLGPTLRRALVILLKNFIFWVPKRAVHVDITVEPAGLPRNADALTLNKYMEKSFNSPEPELPTLVSYSRFKEELPILPVKLAEQEALKEIPAEIVEKVRTHVALIAEVSIDTITLETQLGDDLGLDSLTMAELLMWLDREFEAHDVELGELVTVGSLARAAAGHLGSKEIRKEYVVPASWSSSADNRPDPVLSSAVTIPEAFLLTSANLGDLPAVGDERTGVLSWNTLRLGILLLARHIATLPGTHIGLLFPASVAGTMTAMAAMIAGKIPVFLNWTAGKRSLEHACSETDISAILTARSFLDIVPTDLEFLENRFVFLEDIKKGFTLRDKLAAKRLTRESTSQILTAFGTSTIKGSKTAVVLFTSGSEALPKGVPLTHSNIISNVSGTLEAFKLNRWDVLLGFLPPFHSFGLTICTLLPLMTGLRVAYYPNPNESRRVAKSVAKWGATLAAGTPTFLRSVLKAGAPALFGSLRTLVSGAERAPQELFDIVLQYGLNTQVLEGYGITECAPVVSVTPPGEPRVGVGKPLSGVTIKIVDPESLTPVPPGTQGLVLIRGANVFPGYLDPHLNPFIELADKRWYNSGDLGKLENGSLVITGRLKRFIKIAGEMVSLSAVEEALQPHIPSADGTPTLAVLPKGSEGETRPLLILLTSGSLTRDRANEILHTSGFPHLVHISEVRSLKAIPILGSGKTDYQSLKALL